MTPTIATASREFIDPKTGQTWTLSYTRTSLGHTVRCEPPFGVAATNHPSFETGIKWARRAWRLFQSNLIRKGLVAA